MDLSTFVEHSILTDQQRALVRTLIYFDIFKHPLREEEIERFAHGSINDRSQLRDDLRALCQEGSITNKADFYGIGELADSIEARKADNLRAEERMAKAERMSRLIGRFPFVRAVMLSGSISKGRIAEDGDIDYFVITEPGRLWFARTLLIAFKKIFLLNSHRDFCVNYFVDSDHLTIEDRNQFTAMEVMTLVPTWNGPLCARFFQANVWARELLPNMAPPCADAVTGNIRRTKRMLEAVLRGNFGDEIDEWCMLRTLKHWRAKFPEIERAQFDVALRTRKYVSKHHPRNFQQRVLEAFSQGISRFEREHGLALSRSESV
jgi:predicted nucleotidyltransferase